MKSIRSAVGFAALVIELGLLSACGMAPKAEAPSSGAAAPAAEATPTSADDREPTTLADAEALLEKARGDLDRLALNEPGMPATASAGGAPPPAAAPAPATAAPEAAPSRDEARRADKSAASVEEGERPQAKQATTVSTCETACKAFSSLSRASDAVCRLDTDGGKRCERAKQIQQDAMQRVASCGCSK